MATPPPPAGGARASSHALALAALVLLAGCAGLWPLASEAPTDRPAPGDPAGDRIGWEGGLWHNESIDVDQSDGLTDAELAAYVNRSMARVEYLREQEFEETVGVSVETRAEFRNRTTGGEGDDGPTAHERWNDQVWEALWIVGEDTGSNDEIDETVSSSVVGYYASGDDQIKLIVPEGREATIDNATLVHELVHALQDQRGDLGRESLQADTQDAQLASRAVTEGEANLVEALYADRCGAEWDCVETPASEGGSGGGGGGSGPNLGVYLTLFFPYSDGPPYLQERREAGGWAAVDAVFESPPNTTEQVIHHTDEPAADLAFEDTARGGWVTFPDQGDDGADVAGEASIFAMLWYQSRTAGAGAIDHRELTEAEGPYDRYDYASPPSAGWGADRLVPYRDDGEGGYVWVTEWDDPTDAEEFHAAYLDVLEAHDARSVGDADWVVESGRFADAFRVVRDGTRVTIVNAPEREDLDDLRPDLAGEGAAPPVVTTPEVPGFGPAAAALALLVAVGGAARLARREGAQ